MAVRLYSLRGVPDEEVNAIRELLDKHFIDYYESPAGAWGISAGAIWLIDAEQEFINKSVDPHSVCLRNNFFAPIRRDKYLHDIRVGFF